MRKVAGFLGFLPSSLMVLAFSGLAALPLGLAAQESGSSAVQPAIPQSQPPALAAQKIVPQLMRYTGLAANRAGDTVEATFSVYSRPQGGDPLWSETQRVQVGQDGRFTVLLGSVTDGGLPQNLFSAGQGQWLDVSIERAEEQPRVKLASVAYAMKAADAETLAGLPAAEFVTQEQLGAAAQVLEAGVEALGKVNPETTPTGSGTANMIPKWTGSSTLGDSLISEVGTNIGIGTTAPATTLDVDGATTVRGELSLPSVAATASSGKSSPALELEASTFSSTTSAAVPQKFAFQAVSSGNHTASPTANLELLFGAGSAGPRATGLSIAPNGQITFAAGQKFPGAATGTITGVFAGTALTGGGSTGTVTLNVDTTQVPLLSASNTFSGYQTINNSEYVSGNATVSGTLTAGTTSSPAYSSPDNDGVNAVTDSGAAVWGYSWHAYGGIFESTNDTKIQAGPDYFVPALWATNYGSGGALEARNSGYGTAAFIYSYGQSSISQDQIKNYNAALWADSSGMNGMIGSSDGYNGGSFFNNSSGYATVLAKNYSSGGTGLAVGVEGKDFGEVIRAEGSRGVCGINTSGDVSCTGELKALAATQGGARQVETYAVQSSESWLEDFGSGTLDHGRAVIQFDATFADAANTGVEYHVFLTPKGDAQTLYVTNEGPAGFEVRESAHGVDSIGFDYRIVAKRKGHETERLVDVTERFAQEKEVADNPPTRPAGPAPVMNHPMNQPRMHQASGTPWRTQATTPAPEHK
jgi:hypothetical protein